ncbi:MAG TPA: hypothetical protein PL072_10245 [Phycisphaerales bacterium]|nr:hypothetical protein [Phycisphaerales bacterium]
MLMVPVLGADPVLPAWLVMPLAGVTLLVIAAHVVAMHVSEMPVKRRRIRSAAGVLMMMVTALLAYALGVLDALPSPASDPQATRAFVLCWLAILGLLMLVVMLAVIDLGHTARLAAAARKDLRRELRLRLERELTDRASRSQSQSQSQSR